MGKIFINVPPDFQHPKDADGVLIPGAHHELLYSLPSAQRTHFQVYETVSEGTPVSPISPTEEALYEWMAAEDKARSRQLTGSGIANLAGRVLPGAKEVTGREFMYIESAEDESFDGLADCAFAVRGVARSRAGGAEEEKVRIKLKDGVSLMGISYKGDIEGWRAGFVGLCEMEGRKYGFIRGNQLFLSDGSAPSLEELQIDF